MTLHIDTLTPFRDMHANATPIRATGLKAWAWRNCRPLVWWPLLSIMALTMLAVAYAVAFVALPAIWGAAVALLDAVQCMNCGGL
jgi:hypothetical protein